MRKFFVFLFLIIPLCLQAKGVKDGVVMLNDTPYAAGKVYPEIVRPGDMPFAVFNAKKKCDVRITVYTMDGTVIDEKTVNNISGKGGIYINTVKMKEGLYFCSITCLRGGKILNQTLARFVFTSGKSGKPKI